MNCTEKVSAEFESFESFFAGLPMQEEKNAMILYERYVQSVLTSKIAQAIAEERKRVVGEIEKFGKECEELKANGICGHFNCGTGQVDLDDLLSSLDKPFKE